MSLIKVKPTSPGSSRRHQVVNPGLHKGRSACGFAGKQTKHAGRNNRGHITTRLGWWSQTSLPCRSTSRRNKDGIPAKVERIEYDPNRTRISLCCVMRMVSAVTSSPARSGDWSAVVSGPRPRSRPAMPCRCAIFRLVRWCTAWK